MLNPFLSEETQLDQTLPESLFNLEQNSEFFTDYKSDIGTLELSIQSR